MGELQGLGVIRIAEGLRKGCEGKEDEDYISILNFCPFSKRAVNRSRASRLPKMGGMVSDMAIATGISKVLSPIFAWTR